MEKYKRSILIVVLLAITLPFLLAVLLGGEDWVFAGFLLNPIDNASYLAKMQHGAFGEWRFTLPYTVEPGSGGYVYLFYLALGHLARLLGLPLILVFHLARIAGAVALLLALFDFFAQVFPARPDLQRTAGWLAGVGAGMGWLVVFAGPPPADFWVAEAYPFLSMYTNPHFPIGLALVVWVFSLLLKQGERHRLVKLALAGLLLSIILPFGVVVALIVAAGWSAWTWLETRCLEWKAVFCLGALGGPYLLYQFWVIQSDPVLSGWNAQNINLSPPAWDFLLSFSPAVLLALAGIRRLWGQANSAPRRMLIAWFALGLVLIYFPVSIQRRFMLGFYIPAVALCVWGIDALRDWLAARFPALQKRLVPLVFSLALPSTILVLLTGVFGAVSHAPLLYLPANEAQAMDWIRANTPEQAVFLAAPETGQWLPALTGRRVIYGHPYETVNAAGEEAWVRSAFQAGSEIPVQRLVGRGIDYVFYGPRERSLNTQLDWASYDEVYRLGEVSIYMPQRGP